MTRLLFLLRAALVFLCLGAAPLLLVPPVAAQAQDQSTAPDYPAWEKFATHAESVISDAHTTNLALDQLRKTVVDWRSQFQAAQSANKTRIVTLQTQIAALGAPPAEGVTEAPEIAQRRTALGDQLAKLQAPGLAADEAYSRADGIVREIDKVQLTRQADALMHLSPAPVNPANWPAALKVVSNAGTSIWGEILDAWSIDNRRAELGGNLPLILGYLAFALVLLARGQRWIGLGVAWVRRRSSDRGVQALVLLASLGQIALPFLGVLALVQAISSTGLLGMVGQSVLRVLAPMGLTIFAARWLGGQMFPRQPDARAVLDLTPERRTEGRFHATLLGVLVALEVLRGTLIHPGTEQEAANAVTSFPILALAGFALFRLGRLLKLHATSAGEADAVTSYRHQVVGLIARAVMVLAAAAPLFAAAGYIAAASAAIFPTALSLALMGLLVLAQRLVDDVYRWITGAPATDDDGLLPVLIGFALTLLLLPVFALVWGARVADLTELWTQFSQGFSIGTTRISPANFLTFAILFALGYGVTRLVQGALKATVLPKTRIDLGGQNAIVVGVGYIGIVLAALIAITAAGIDLSGLAIVAGALSVGIGFGLQNIVSNFVSGIILLIERPVSEGDWIEAGGVQGTVRSISVRSTRIETFDRADVIVPNSNLITGTVTNMTKFSRIGRLIVPIGVAYGTDTRKVDRVLREIAEAHPLVVLNPKPIVLFAGFGADALNFEIRAILRDVNFVLDVRNEMNHQIAERFAKEGFEIPFAQRDIWIRNPETLRGAPPKETP
ncbi:MAG: DUF3772 domain-containing protein [Rhodobacteraceae bacterium]|nr:DUF3772 domain-containing protein [Paracoccaceae bacterium]